MNYMPELVKQIPRGRPPKAKPDDMSDLKHYVIDLEELNEPKRRGRPPTLTKPGKPTPDDIAKDSSIWPFQVEWPDWVSHSC